MSSDFATFYRTYHPRAERLARRIVGPAYAEDIAQTAMLAAFERFDSLDLERDPGPWISTVVRNTCRSFVRRERTALLARAEVAAPESVQDVERTALARDRCRTVGRRLRAVPAGDRELFLAHVIDGVPCSSLARHRGVSSGAVRSLVFRVRRRLDHG